MRRQYKCCLSAAAPEAVGFWEKPVLTVFPKVDGPSGRGLMAPPGLTPLGAKGSVRDRLRLPDGLRASPRELYSTALCVSRMGYASQPKLASSLPNKRPSF